MRQKAHDLDDDVVHRHFAFLLLDFQDLGDEVAVRVAVPRLPRVLLEMLAPDALLGREMHDRVVLQLIEDIVERRRIGVERQMAHQDVEQLDQPLVLYVDFLDPRAEVFVPREDLQCARVGGQFIHSGKSSGWPRRPSQTRRQTVVART